MRKTFVYRDGVWVEKEFAPPLESKGPYVIQDTIDPTWNPLTGGMETSKSNMRKIAKAKGCIEVGNEKIPEYRPPDVPNLKEDLIRSYDELAYRRR